MDMMQTADCPFLSQPMSCPRKVAPIEHAIPMMMVTRIPPGSLPGMNSLAKAPTTSPMRISHINANTDSPSLSGFDEAHLNLWRDYGLRDARTLVHCAIRLRRVASGSFLSLGDLGQRDCQRSAAKSFDQPGVLGIEGTCLVDDGRVGLLCVSSDLLHGFWRNALSLFGSDRFGSAAQQ